MSLSNQFYVMHVGDVIATETLLLCVSDTLKNFIFGEKMFNTRLFKMPVHINLSITLFFCHIYVHIF